MKRRKFRVRMIFRYTDTIELEAKDLQEAERVALEMSEPQYDSHIDTETRELP